ncbi:MAG: hypothetical protein RJA36_1913 [Pseudomonadota bacterium]|jgi:prophage regulatory protein
MAFHACASFFCLAGGAHFGETMALIRLPAVKAQCGYPSDTSIYNNIRAGLFPRPVPIGARAVGWPDDEVDAINSARIAGADDDALRALVERLHAKRAERLALLAA